MTYETVNKLSNKLEFRVIYNKDPFPEKDYNKVYLKIDFWNDLSFVTMFNAVLFKENGEKVDLGAIKIGFAGQNTAHYTFNYINLQFERLPDKFFSVGQDISFYEKLYEQTTSETMSSFLLGLRDVVFNESALKVAMGEQVFNESLLRSVSISSIEGEYRRIIRGFAPQSDFNFGFYRPQSTSIAGIDLSFVVNTNSIPITNIHALIGRNGIGKTTLLNEIIAGVMKPEKGGSFLYNNTKDEGKKHVDSKYFSRLISVSFSAFDPFNPPEEQTDPEFGTTYYYIGLKDLSDTEGQRFKSLRAMRRECVESLIECFSNKGKRERWQEAITTLESDGNFAQMNLKKLADLETDLIEDEAGNIVRQMSSGHAVVLLVITKLVVRVEEKTLVLLDEPESHLHPPLLSAFTRALSQLLHNRNGVAIIATHSPVVLQELPKSCAWVMTRSGASMHAEKPRIETFGENVGVLTREVFGLEVVKSGYHSLLELSVNENKSYEDIISQYNEQIGLEARGMLRAMIVVRDAKGNGK